MFHLQYGTHTYTASKEFQTELIFPNKLLEKLTQTKGPLFMTYAAITSSGHTTGKLNPHQSLKRERVNLFHHLEKELIY